MTPAVTLPACETEEIVAGFPDTQNCDSLERRDQELVQDRSIEDAFSSTQVTAVGQNDGQTSQDADFTLRASIPEPAPRAEETGRIGNSAAVETGAELHGEETVLIKVLIHFPVGY